MTSKQDQKIKDLKEEAQEEQGNERFPKLKPKTAIELEEWRDIINDNFPELVLPAEVGLSVIAQLLIEDIKNPFALVYVDVPSSGKTITLNFFSNLKELIYTTDDFTPASFVSHSANTKKEDLAKIDLLPKIQYRTLVVRDLAPIFAKRDEDVQAMLGVLIRVLDGEGLENNSGVYGRRGYSGDYHFMLMSASTPIRPRIWKAMGNLGSRLFFLNIEGKEKNEETLAEQLSVSCREKELVCREATDEFIRTLWNKYPEGITWNAQGDEIELKKIIARLAKILARLRSSINVWEEGFGNKKYNHTSPVTEMPDRLNQLIYNLTRGHALVAGRNKISLDDINIALRVTLDSAPPNRSKIFKALLKNNGSLMTSEVMDTLQASRPTALRMMKELSILNIVDSSGDLENDSDFEARCSGKPEQQIFLKNEYAWFISEEFKNL